MVKDKVYKPTVGITMGDINGISPEVIMKALADERIFDHCRVLVYGSTKVFSYYSNRLEIKDFKYASAKGKMNPKITNVVNCWDEEVNIEPGESSEQTGRLALVALQKAISHAKDGHIDVLITGPLDKSTVNLTEEDFAGQTEYLQREFEADNSLMFLVNDDLRVALVTTHIPLKEVTEQITSEKVTTKLKMLNRSLREDFMILKPKIAVLGLNPHAGDNGLLGREETDIIIPGINKAKEKGVYTFGPYPSDGFFGSQGYKQFDAILAIYHDQGLIPFKTITFGSGVNFTAGLPIVRTSPDHGTAYDIAGDGKASPESMRRAIFQGLSILANRKEFKEITANPLKKSKLEEEAQ